MPDSERDTRDLVPELRFTLSARYAASGHQNADPTSRHRRGLREGYAILVTRWPYAFRATRSATSLLPKPIWTNATFERRYIAH